jgi:dienelactone hydrolase
VAEVVVFHHAFGLTDRVRLFAAALRDGGHTVHTPDLYDGRTFETIEDGMAYSEKIGGPMAIVDRARAAVESLSSEVVYVGFSLGVLPAQSLAQTRPGARGSVLCYAAVPLGEWGDTWPATWPEGVRLQLHILDGDEDFEIAQGLAATVPEAELFVYPGSEHYFAEHDDQAAALLTGMLAELVEADADAGRLLACTLFARAGRLADPVYVHAKIGIVDDTWLTLGSANLNEHSLFNDTEMNVVTHDTALARQTRLRLWAEHLELPIEQVAGEPAEVIDDHWKPISSEQLARRQAGQPLTHRLVRLAHVSRRSERLLGPLQGLLLDG